MKAGAARSRRVRLLGWSLFVGLGCAAALPLVATLQFASDLPALVATEVKASLTQSAPAEERARYAEAAARLVAGLEERVIRRIAVVLGVSAGAGIAVLGLTWVLCAVWRRAASALAGPILQLARGDFDAMERLRVLGILEPLGNALSVAGRQLKKTMIAREYVRHVTEAFPGAIMVTDASNRVIVWNEAARRITGYSAADVLGRTCDTTQGLVCGADSLPCPRVSGFPLHQVEMPLVRKDGQEIVISKSSDLLPQPDGGAPGTIEVFFDVTEKRRFQDQLLEQKAELQASRSTALRALEDLKVTLAALEKAKETAEEASQLKSQFLANVSHEIRTPLNAIMGFAALLREGPLFPEEAEYTDMIARSSEYLKELIDQVLDLEKIHAGKLDLANKNFAPRALVESVGLLIRSKAQAKGLAFEERVHPEVPEQLEGDGTRIRQILINLVTNAVKFTEEGTVTVELSSSNPGLGIRVSDTGPGVPEADLDRIFDPFYQVDGAANRRHGGVGLGLSIVKGLTAAMGGTVEAESLPGGGAAFTVHLPSVRPASRPERSPSAVEIGPAGVEGRGRILLVENDPPSALLVRTLLGKSGYTVAWAEGGKEGLARFAEGGWDAVLLDMQMPGIDGYEVARRIRQRTEGAEVPIVALTAHATEGDREKCLAAGCTDYLAKPFDRNELLGLLARLLADQQTYGPEIEALRREYLGNVETELAAARREVDCGDLTGLSRRAHSLKGSGGTYGFPGVSRGAADLEQACEQGDRDAVSRALDAFREHVRTLAALAESERPGALTQGARS